MVDPAELLNRKFEKKHGGYRIDEVDRFMVEVASRFSQVSREVTEQKRLLAADQQKITEYEKDQKNLGEVLLNAQRLSDSILRDARARAEKIEQEATGKANSLIGEIRGEIIAEQEKLVQIKREVSEFRSKLLNMYRAHLELIKDMPVFEDLAAQPEETPAEAGPEPEQATEPIAPAAPAEGEPEATAAKPEKKAAEGTPADAPAEQTAFEQAAAAVAEPEPKTAQPEESGPRVEDVKLNVRFDEESGEYVPISSAGRQHHGYDSYYDKRR